MGSYARSPDCSGESGSIEPFSCVDCVLKCLFYLIWFLRLDMYAGLRLRSISASNLAFMVFLIKNAVRWDSGELTMVLWLFPDVPPGEGLNAEVKL